jgi:hypothetical protein
VQPVLEQLLGQQQQLARQHDDEVGPVAGLGLLHFGGEHEHLGGRVLDLELLHDGRRVVRDEQLLEMVDHHLVHAVRAERRAHARAQLLGRLNVLEGGLLEAGEVLRTLLEHALHAEAAATATSRAQRRAGG